MSGSQALEGPVFYRQETPPDSFYHACQSEMQQGEPWTKEAQGGGGIDVTLGREIFSTL